MTEPMTRIERELELSWSKTTVRVAIYLPYKYEFNIFITIVQGPGESPRAAGGADIVCLNLVDVKALAEFVETVRAEAKEASLAVC